MAVSNTDKTRPHKTQHSTVATVFFFGSKIVSRTEP